MSRKYRELQTESCGIRWVSDGSIDVKKNFQVSMNNYFSLSNEMTFIIVFNMLYTRDRHQLFELLCLQLTSIILAYREGIKEMTRSVEDGGEEFYKPEEFLNCKLSSESLIKFNLNSSQTSSMATKGSQKLPTLLRHLSSRCAIIFRPSR